MDTILIARYRATGKDVLLAGREVPYQEKLAKYKELARNGSDEFSNAILIQDNHIKKPLRLSARTPIQQRSQIAASVNQTESKPDDVSSKPEPKKNRKQ